MRLETADRETGRPDTADRETVKTVTRAGRRYGLRYPVSGLRLAGTKGRISCDHNRQDVMYKYVTKKCAGENRGKLEIRGDWRRAVVHIGAPRGAAGRFGEMREVFGEHYAKRSLPGKRGPANKKIEKTRVLE